MSPGRNDRGSNDGASSLAALSTVAHERSRYAAASSSHLAPLPLASLLDARSAPAETRVLTPRDVEQLRRALPSRYVCSDWYLLYSTTVHGTSLNTLHMRASGSGGCILALRDRSGGRFGGFASEWREPEVPPRFYGSGECFLFHVQPPDQVDSPDAVHVHRWAGANSHYLFSHKDHLAMGSGGRFGLWVDSELLHGSSGPSETFGNPCLCDPAASLEVSEDGWPTSREFVCDVLEVWGVDANAIATRQAHLEMMRSRKA